MGKALAKRGATFILMAGVLLLRMTITAGFGSEIYELDKGLLDLVVEMAHMSEAAYDATVMPYPSKAWVEIGKGDDISGLRWRLSEKQTENGNRILALSFAGTEIKDLRDWKTDIRQALQPNFIPPDQYRHALELTQKFLTIADKNPKIQLILAGHSLGGGIAQYVAIKTGVRAVVFNAAALGPTTVNNLGQQLVDASGHSRLITNVHMRWDPVYEGTQIIGGKKFGAQYVVDEAPGTAGILPADQSLMKSVSNVEKVKSAFSRHDMKNLITALEFERAYGPSMRKALDSMQKHDRADHSIPIWWATSTPEQQRGGDYGAVDLLGHMAKQINRVAVAGTGTGADRLYRQMVSRLGSGNVQRIESIDDSVELRRRASGFKPDLIMAVKSDSSIPLMPNERFAVPVAVAENFADAISTAASALHELRGYYKKSESLRSKILHSNWLDPGNEKLNDKLGSIQELYTIASAIKDDIEAAANGELVLVRSNTFDALAKMALEKSWNRVIEDLAEKGVIKKGSPDFGAFELMYGLERVSRHGKVDITAIEHGLDALVGLSWAGLGWVVSGGNTGVSSAFQEIGQTLAGIGRSATQGMADSIFARLRCDVELHVTDWRTRQELNLKLGKPLQSFEEYFDEKEVKRMGISEQHLNVLRDQYLLYVRTKSLRSSEIINEIPINKPDEFKKKIDEIVPDSQQRIVVVGHGRGPDNVYEYAVKRFGQDNVIRVYSSRDRYRVQRVAGEFAVAAVIDADSLSSTGARTTGPGGVSMNMSVVQDSFFNDQDGKLNKTKKDILLNRKANDSLSWTADD